MLECGCRLSKFKDSACTFPTAMSKELLCGEPVKTGIELEAWWLFCQMSQ